MNLIAPPSVPRFLMEPIHRRLAVITAGKILGAHARRDVTEFFVQTN
jgi:hypothetical protein